MQSLANWIITPGIIVLLFLCLELGSRMRSQIKVDPVSVGGGQLVTANFTLLSLLIAFTFNLALNRHDGRQAMLVDDSNAIRATYFIARFVDDPNRTRLRKSLHEYANLQLDFVQSNRFEQESLIFKAKIKRKEIRSIIVDIFPTLTNDFTRRELISNCNLMLSYSVKMESIFMAHIPTRVIFLLFLYGGSSMLVLGISLGPLTPRLRFPTALLSALLGMALATIIDLDTPQHGAVKLQNANLLSVIADTERGD